MNLLSDIAVPFEYKGVDLFASSKIEILHRLEKDDPDLRESNGFLIFFGLGLALTGFQNEKPEQKAITIFGPDHPWIGKKPTA